MNNSESIKKYFRAANYLSATQIYLQDNFLLKRKLSSEDIKPRLFGHWGTGPGINFLYANLNPFIKEHNIESLFVLGPGHGLPALAANLFLEGTLGKYYPEAKHDASGVGFISKQFSWPYGFSSHSSPEIPGLILEGGELGYSLSTAYGAIMDNPDLLAVCLVGDGEAETGPISAAWHLNKLINPTKNGNVLPVLHLNRYKISGPSIFGRMEENDLLKLFEGYGYDPVVVGGEEIFEKMPSALNDSYEKIKEFKKEGSKVKPPLIILDTPKGWTTVKELRGQKIEGTILSHQVVMPNVKRDDEELDALEKWLKSYEFNEIFDEEKGFEKDIMDLIPDEGKRLGDNEYVTGARYKELKLPSSKDMEKELVSPGVHQSNSMRAAGEYFRETFTLNEKERDFRLMSPDETYSNRLDDVFSVTTRAFVLPTVESDSHMGFDGRVMEMLSEHNLHGLAQGYILTGRHAVFSSYEAFAQIISSMAQQYIKFVKVSKTVPWRNKVSSMNYLLSSTAWRQEHNGFSHQNPSFISGMLEKNNCFVKVYFPVDDNSMLAVLDEVMTSTECVNTIVAGKSPEPRWLDLNQAKDSLKDGISTWDFISDEDPDLVFVGIGDYVTREAIAAIEILKKQVPDVRLRFVNIARLSGKCSCKDASHPQITNPEEYLTESKPVIINFHGYPEVAKSIFFDLGKSERFSVHGYTERGGTTTPFDMLVRNGVSRYHLAMEAAEILAKRGVITEQVATETVNKFQEILANHYAYIMVHGKDPEDIENWQLGKKPLGEYDAEEISKVNILKDSKTIAVVGLSDKPNRHSYEVASYLKDRGYRIIPVNPNAIEVLGEKSYKSISDIPRDINIDIVDIFRRPEEVIGHMKEVIDYGGIKTVWLAEGTSSVEAEEFARDFGLTLVSNFCILEAYKKIREQ